MSPLADTKVVMRTMQDLSSRIRTEYLEMPGLRLKAEQVQRLCGIEQRLCALILDSLVASKFLYVTLDGQYARLTEGKSVITIPRRQPATPIPDDACSPSREDAGDRT